MERQGGGSISEDVTCGQGWSEVSWPSRHLEESLQDRGEKKSKSPENERAPRLRGSSSADKAKESECDGLGEGVRARVRAEVGGCLCIISHF